MIVDVQTLGNTKELEHPLAPFLFLEHEFCTKERRAWCKTAANSVSAVLTKPSLEQ